MVPSLVDTNFHVIAPGPERAEFPLHFMPGTSTEFSEDQVTTADDLTGIMDAAGVAQGFLISSRFHGFDNRYCLASVRRHPGRFVAIANINIFAADAAAQLDYWVGEHAMSGVRFWGNGRGTATWIGDDRYQQVWRRLQELAVPCNAQTTTPAALPATIAFAQRYPGVPLTINNLAHVDPAQGPGSEPARLLRSLARFPDVYVNMSAGFLSRTLGPASAEHSFLRMLHDSFGAGRLMWSAFYPSLRDIPYATSVSQVRAAADWLPADDRRLLLGGAARRLYPALQTGS